MDTTLKKAKQHVLFAASLLLIIILVGTAGYAIIEGWDILDAIYMTIISITTTGFQEIYPLSHIGRIFTIFIIIAGVLTIAYTGGRVIQFVVEMQLFRRRRMSKKVEELSHHFIVCGFGRMGKHVCEELANAQREFVVIEKDPQQLELISEAGYLFVAGDATNDDILMRAGVQKARGLVAVLPTDAENVFTTLSAKVLNPNIFVVARAVEEETESKLRKAGADRVVKPYEIGGSRIAQVLLRPGVVDFIDLVARHRNVDLNLEEIIVQPGSSLVGQTLAHSPLRRQLNIIVVAIFRKKGPFIFNPTSQTTIQAGDRLIAIGSKQALVKLNEICLVEDLSQSSAKSIGKKG